MHHYRRNVKKPSRFRPFRKTHFNKHSIQEYLNDSIDFFPNLNDIIAVFLLQSLDIFAAHGCPGCDFYRDWVSGNNQTSYLERFVLACACPRNGQVELGCAKV